MCKSRAEGGQRCFSHALSTYEKERDQSLVDMATLREQGYQVNVTEADFGLRDTRVHDRRIELASTASGRDLIESWKSGRMGAADAELLHNMWGNDQEAVNGYLDRVIETGRDLQERNSKFAELAKADKRQDYWNRAKHIASMFAIGAGTAGAYAYKFQHHSATGLAIATCVVTVLKVGLIIYARHCNGPVDSDKRWSGTKEYNDKISRAGWEERVRVREAAAQRRLSDEEAKSLGGRLRKAMSGTFAAAS